MQVGPLEILVVAALALIVFGPQRLPEMARTVARAIGELRRMAQEVKTEFETGLDDEDVPDGSDRVADEVNVDDPPADPDGAEPTEPRPRPGEAG
ncbi:MAG: Sec-independent protein translocase protein TatB [Actinomycetota bacterium]|nr:Sec-independent protein translocase protein TatB [Actinomycetota bacterium]